MDLIPNYTPEQHEERKAAQHKQLKFIGRAKKKKGCNLYGKDRATGDVYEVQFIKNIIINGLTKKMSNQYKATIAPDDHYTWAINMKNAIRKFNKDNHEKRIPPSRQNDQ